MKPFLLFLSLIVALSSMTGCKKKSGAKSSPPLSLTADQAKNPVGVFCGSDCSNCGFNVTKCLTLLKENLPNLCGGPYKTNCYTLWMSYSKTCYALCGEKKEK